MPAVQLTGDQFFAIPAPLALPLSQRRAVWLVHAYGRRYGEVALCQEW